MSDTEFGEVLAVTPRTAGSSLVTGTLTGETVLYVDDAFDFNEGGGELLLNGAVMDFIEADLEADTVTLAAPLTTDVDEELYVAVWDAAQGEPVTEYWATVDLDDSEGGDPIDVVIPHDTIDKFPLAIRAEAIGEAVEIRRDDPDGEWYVHNILGQTPVIDGTYIEPGTLPDSGPGQTFSTDLPPATADGYAEDHAWWQVVAGDVLGFWRVSAGAWVAQQVVTSEALRATNALIDALQTVDLSTVNFEAVNIDGGSIYIAQGVADSLVEDFSGTALPPGWAATKTGAYGGGTPGASLPGPSVVATGPTGQDGSALLIDFGPSGITDASADGSGEVSTTLSEAADAVITIRYRLAVGTGGLLNPDDLRLAIRRQDGAAWSSTADMVALSLVPSDLSGFGDATLDITSTFNGSVTSLGSVPITTDPSTDWHFASFRVQGGAVSAKVWRDGDPEPGWTVVQQGGVVTPGMASLVWRQIVWSATTPTRGQKVWVDSWDAQTFETGFKVNADGTGEWPAIGLSPGDAAWREVGAVGEPSFQNGWAGTLSFRKSPTGEVTLRGDLTIPAGGHQTTVFTLPTSHRPPVPYLTQYAWQNTSARLAGVSVNANGTVVWENFNNSGGTRTVFTVRFSTL